MTSRMRWKKPVFILSLLLAATWTANAANTVTNFRLKDETATAMFQAGDPLDPCLESLVSVVASDDIEKVSPGGPTPALRTVLVVIQRDACTNTVLFGGQGDTTNHTFQVASNLGSATLTATVPLEDAVSTLVFPFQVSMTWEATGKPQFVHFKETFQDPEVGIKITARSRSTLAEATASGTVFGLGQNHTPEASDSATIQKQFDGTLVIQKTP
jgi:hypothetical protein